MGVNQHGVESAHYTNGHSGYRPVMVCICGFGTEYGCRSWEEAGYEFDLHLHVVANEIKAADDADETT